ncbi:MAG: hypothetical protein ACC652_13365, partial [Acidimicrobiales bacterium]
RGLPMDKELNSIWLREPSSEIPRNEHDQVIWLYDQWKTIDTWLDGQDEQEDQNNLDTQEELEPDLPDAP